MTRQSIKGFFDHTEFTELEKYNPVTPLGIWTARLDFHAWGKSSNLFCFFTDIETNLKYRLSVFSRQLYRPYKSSISFREEPAGGIFKITTSETKNGNIKFENAEKI